MDVRGLPMSFMKHAPVALCVVRYERETFGNRKDRTEVARGTCLGRWGIGTPRSLRNLGVLESDRSQCSHLRQGAEGNR